MSTRSTVHIENENGEHIGTIYRQHNGQLTGMGQDILDILRDATDAGFEFHDISELGLYLFAMLRSSNVHGQICLTAEHDRDKYDYTYVLSADGLLSDGCPIWLRVSANREHIYDSLLSDFKPQEIEDKLAAAHS